ncbi:MAG: ice-binding family protein [Candidatus Cloacimonadales bacterium]|nr:ice-binding family protein [Candidatus Cloacimonadales bacterium]
MKKMILLISMIFTISSAIFCDGPATVNLGTSENYVILAKTVVSTTGTTAIVGNIGVSPAAATYITGFGLIMDPSGTFSTSSLVTGRIYAADYTPPTPANLTTAISDMEAAYTDAAGRPDPDFTELYAGDLTGQTLIPALYKWSTGVLISAAGVTISGNPDDVWLFQISGNLTVANGAIITLNGGAQPQNIFWQVAGETTIGTTAQFKGIILCQTLISMDTYATVNGRLLAQSATTSDGNSVVEPNAVVSAFEEEIPYAGSENTLISNYPNPFNPTTNIRFDIKDNESSTLTIFNLKGQKVRTLINAQLAAGQHSVTWDGTDDNGNQVTSGIYLYKLKTDGRYSCTRKMILLK